MPFAGSGRSGSCTRLAVAMLRFLRSVECEMAGVQMFGLKNCDTCRKARTWLDARGAVHAFIDYRDQPVPAETLRAWAEAVGGWEKVVNRASTTWRGLPEDCKAPTDAAAWTSLIAKYPALVRRPVLVRGGGEVSVGFKEATWAGWFA
jgi:Spx/MgsR family transcriptional regulator